MAPTFVREEEITERGIRSVVGLDEVGRGAWAGPLVVGAVMFTRPFPLLPGLRDSKKLSPRMRECLAEEIRASAQSIGLGWVSAEELDAVGLGAALGLAATRAIEELSAKPEFALLDGKVPYQDFPLPHKCVVGGDDSVGSIAAASIIAKVTRDKYMMEVSATDPTLTPFSFEQNKGYPSLHHRQALAMHGPTLLHRKSFRPIAALSK